MQAALEILGMRCYHMTEIPSRRAHLVAWYGLMVEERPMNWGSLFAKYDATVDFPTCLFYGELLREFPQAKVVLNVRDHDAWFASWLHLRDMVDAIGRYSFIPQVRRFHVFERAMVDRYLAGGRDPVATIEAKRQHEAEVRSSVPADQLLVFDVREGWGPLCAFLEVPVPADTPFPHLNEGTETLRQLFYRTAIRKALVALCFGSVVAGFVAWGLAQLSQGA